jgi:hypothetical protein
VVYRSLHRIDANPSRWFMTLYWHSARRAAWRIPRLRRWLIALLPLAVGRPIAAQETSVSPHGPLATECSVCHSAQGWKPVHPGLRFDHAAFDFPLKGAHKAAACMSCHRELTFAGTATRCVECHFDVHRGEFGPGCEGCHTFRAFTDRSVVTRMHETLRFRLDGAHRGADCEDCHRPAGQGRLQFVGTPTACSDCHARDFRSAAVGGHGPQAAVIACEQCHRASTWMFPDFAHNPALTGAHRAITCEQCHASLNYQGTATDCVGCHRRDYDNPATQPNHAQSGFSTQCDNCHVTSSWTAAYDHNRTQFPLTGAHRAVACDQCHGDGVYLGKPTTCVPCHQSDYDQTTAPRHTLPTFVATCETCHSTAAWLPASFNHDRTQFPLTGRHRSASCAQCHGDGVYQGKGTDCYSCHQRDYQSNSDHVRDHVRLTCQDCHSTSRWGD